MAISTVSPPGHGPTSSGTGHHQAHQAHHASAIFDLRPSSCDNFLHEELSRARLRHANYGLILDAAQKDASDREGMRELRRARHQADGPAGKGGEPSALRASAVSRPLGRWPCRARRRRRAPVPTSAKPVVTRRNAALGIASCIIRGRPVFRAGHPLAGQDPSQGRA